MCKYGVSSGLCFLVFGLNTGKYRPEKTPYSDTFQRITGNRFDQKLGELAQGNSIEFG